MRGFEDGRMRGFEDGRMRGGGLAVDKPALFPGIMGIFIPKRRPAYFPEDKNLWTHDRDI